MKRKFLFQKKEKQMFERGTRRDAVDTERSSSAMQVKS